MSLFVKLMFVGLLAVFISCDNKDLKKGALPAGGEKKELLIGMHERDMPPFFMKDKKGELIGIDVDLAKGIAQKLGLKPVFVRKFRTFNDIVESLAKGDIDLGISKLTYSDERAKVVSFSDPYLSVHPALLCNRQLLDGIRKKKNLDSIESALKDPSMTIGVFKGSNYAVYAKKLFPKAQIVPMQSSYHLINSVSKGEIGCGLRDEIAIKEYLAKYKEFNLTVFEYALKHETPFHVLIAPNHEKWVEVINTQIEQTKDSRKFEKVVENFKEYVAHEMEENAR